MDKTPDADGSGIDENDLDPGHAAELIAQTAARARHEFDTTSLTGAALGAGVFFFGYGAVWWSMRGQSVYTGPAGWAVAVLYGLIVVAAIVGGLRSRRATAGVGGRARIQMTAAGVAVATAGVSAWIVQGALRFLGVSFEIVYGVYGPTVPLIALAAAATGFTASRAKWAEFSLAIAIMLIAAASTFFGPDGAWGLTGLGCTIALLCYIAVVARRRQRAAHA